VNAFTRHFKENGSEVTALNADSSSWGDLRGAGLVVVCTPLMDAPRTIREAAPMMRAGATLCDASPLKAETFEALREAAGFGMSPLCVHAIPGRGGGGFEAVVVVPVVDGKTESALASALFGGGKLIAATAEAHDAWMSSTVALPFFVNAILAKTLAGEDLRALRELAGESFTAQMEATRAVLGEPPELVEALINGNAFSRQQIGRFIDESRHLRRLIKNDPQRLASYCAGAKRGLAAPGSNPPEPMGFN
jgi:prephenate dehydrogenase